MPETTENQESHKLHQHTVSKRCSSCQSFRIKASDENNKSHGICDNKNVIDQVSLMNAQLIARYFANGNTEEEKLSNAQTIHDSIRFDGDFGCIHHKSQPNDN